LIVNRTAGEDVVLHVSADPVPEFASFREYVAWISKLPTLEEQGDGMRSFTAALLNLKVHPKGLILLDEPEAFLHYPQARKLAEVVANDTASETQIWIATHSDEIVRGLLDNASDRIVIVRLDRIKDVTKAKILDAQQVATLWTDPLLRTSDVLSALFHELAVICEGEADVRFFRALVDANITDDRLPDLRFYQVGGKGKILNIVNALRLLELPVCVLVDIDILADQERFLLLFESLGGERSSIVEDLKAVIRHVSQKKSTLTGRDAASQLRQIADDIQDNPQISAGSRSRIAAIVNETAPWQRVKEVGFRGFANATITQAFERIYDQSKRIGLIINREGELEGLCRDVSQKLKSNWLAEVLKRDLKNDPRLEEARKMLLELRESILGVRLR
jgi:hypothetical protein